MVQSLVVMRHKWCKFITRLSIKLSLFFLLYLNDFELKTIITANIQVGRG